MSDRLAQMSNTVTDTKDQLVSRAKEKADAVVGQTIESLDQQIEVLSERLEQLSNEARRRWQDVDSHLHEKPYMYLAGAGLVGLGLGLYLKAKSSASRDFT